MITAMEDSRSTLRRARAGAKQALRTDDLLRLERNGRLRPRHLCPLPIIDRPEAPEHAAQRPSRINLSSRLKKRAKKPPPPRKNPPTRAAPHSSCVPVCHPSARIDCSAGLGAVSRSRAWGAHRTLLVSAISASAVTAQATWVGFAWGMENSLRNSECPSDHLESLHFCGHQNRN